MGDINTSLSDIKLDMQDIKNLTNSIRDKYGFDFTEYAMSSFKRRLVRVLDLYKIQNLPQLTTKLMADKNLYENFLKEITVNTTEMFRDPNVWQHVREKLIPELKKLNTIRIWHTACSTGEEVYTMAIILREEGLLEKAQILATDINEDVIKVAKSGKYPLRNMPLHNDNFKLHGGFGMLSKYYTNDGTNAFMDSSLIKNVHFQKHDLVLGKMHQKFDVIICRNVLIYFNLPLQDQIIGGFSDSLNENGFLIIGAKESIAWCSSAKNYKTFAPKEKIYSKA
jgi:chemotaxis protein methyltransferase CheR